MSAAVGSLAVVTLLWLGGGGLTSLGATGGTATSLGRLAGLWASDLMLLQVLLMARLPVLERSWGQDQLARWHRWVGFASFDLLLAHVALVLLGYAQTARRGLLAETWNVITTYPGMLLAVAGFAALVMVVVTSLRAARRRLRYESWHLLHLYAYLAVAARCGRAGARCRSRSPCRAAASSARAPSRCRTTTRATTRSTATPSPC